MCFNLLNLLNLFNLFMGVFSFLKDKANDALGFLHLKDKDADANTPDPERRAKYMEIIKNYNLPITNFDIAVYGDKLVVTGEAPNAAIKQKVVLGLGNLPSISEVDDQMTVAAAVVVPTTPAEIVEVEEADLYTVTSGDTLWDLSKKFYNEPGKYMAIFEANRPMLSDPNHLFPGMVIRVPKTPVIKPQVVEPGGEYVVQYGDTLWALAERFYKNGAKYTMIYEANTDKMPDANTINPGQVLRIPILA